jgi:hypothetical protein
VNLDTYQRMLPLIEKYGAPCVVDKSTFLFKKESVNRHGIGTDLIEVYLDVYQAGIVHDRTVECISYWMNGQRHRPISEGHAFTYYYSDGSIQCSDYEYGQKVERK